MDKKEKSINSHIDKAIGYSYKAHYELQIALNIALEGKGLSDEYRMTGEQIREYFNL